MTSPNTERPQKLVCDYLLKLGIHPFGLRETAPGSNVFEHPTGRRLTVHGDGTVTEEGGPPSAEPVPTAPTTKSDTSIPRVAKPAVGKRRSLSTHSLASVTPLRTDYLWRHRIALGELAIVQGDPGELKGHVCIDLAACVTAHRAMPGEKAPGPIGQVVWIATEDDDARAIAPRMIAAGGNRDLINIVEDDEACPITFPSDVEPLRDLIAARNALHPDVPVRLVVIDPFGEYVDSNIDIYKNSVRRMLKALQRVAREFNLAIIIVNHLNKTSADRSQSALHRGGGNLSGIAGNVRFIMLVARDPEDPEARVLAMTKHNLSPQAPSLKFRAYAYDGKELVSQGIEVAHLKWEGVSQYTSDQLVSKDATKEPSKLDEAIELIADAIEDGDNLAVAIERRASEKGISDATLRRAKKRLGVVSQKVGFEAGLWEWVLLDNEGAQARAGKEGENGRSV